MVSARIARHSSETSRTSSSPKIARRPAAARSARSSRRPRRHAGEGDPEQQHQDRHAADDLDIEPRGLPEPYRPRQRHQRHAEPDRRGEREADDGDEDGDADALGDDREDLRVEARSRRSQMHCDRSRSAIAQPPGKSADGDRRRHHGQRRLQPSEPTAEQKRLRRRESGHADGPPAIVASTSPACSRRTTSG